jgi:hypothetical protein
MPLLAPVMNQAFDMCSSPWNAGPLQHFDPGARSPAAPRER